MSQVTQTVSAASIACMAVSGAVALILPIALFVVLRRRFKAKIQPALIGAATFAVFALILEQIMHSLLLGSSSAGAFLTSRWWIWGLYGGLAAGLFEETGRLCAFYFLLRRRHNTLGGALAYGVGHGGFEAIALCTLSMVSNIIAAAFLNTGGVEALAALGYGEQAATLAATLAGTPSAVFLASALERVIAIAFHIAASVLVWLSASGRGPWGLYLLAIGLHAAVNFPAALYSYAIVTNVLLMEAIFAVIVAVICFATVSIYRKCLQNYTPLLNYDPTDFGL